MRSGTQASGTDFALGTEASCAALLDEGDLADAHFRRAIELLDDHDAALFQARTYLDYGEWLRRAGRRAAAREQLRRAYEMLTAMGAEGFAARAKRELQATGEHARRRAPEALDELTPRELHIARLVATGATTKEVGAQLFLSPRTIDAHLRSIFRKLDIDSRRQLRHLRLLDSAPESSMS